MCAYDKYRTITCMKHLIMEIVIRKKCAFLTIVGAYCLHQFMMLLIVLLYK